MRVLISLFWSICRLKSGPQAIPYSLPLLFTLLLMNCLMGWYQFSYRADFATSLSYSLLMQLILAGFTHLILTLRGRTERFIQTLTALVGANVVINIFVYPFILLTPLLTHQAHSVVVLTLFSMILVIAMLVLNVWLLIITAHVYRHALGVNFIVGLLVAITLMGTDVMIFKLIMGS